MLSNQFCDQLLNALGERPKWFVVQTSKEHGRVPLAGLCCICNLFMPYERMPAHRQLHIEALFGQAAARAPDRSDAAEAGWRLGVDIHDVLQNILEGDA